jgi:hypothetical protein
MIRISGLAVVMLCGLMLAGAAQAAAFDLTGAWTLTSMRFVDETGKTTLDFGEHPIGLALYTDNYMSVVINAEGRATLAAGATDADRAKLLATMTSHAGPYRFSDGKLVNHVEAAHDPKMVGKDLVRVITVLDADDYISTTPAVETPDGRHVKTVLTWRRAR